MGQCFIRKFRLKFRSFCERACPYERSNIFRKKKSIFHLLPFFFLQFSKWLPQEVIWNNDFCAALRLEDCFSEWCLKNLWDAGIFFLYRYCCLNYLRSAAGRVCFVFFSSLNHWNVAAKIFPMYYSSFFLFSTFFRIARKVCRFNFNFLVKIRSINFSGRAEGRKRRKSSGSLLYPGFSNYEKVWNVKPNFFFRPLCRNFFPTVGFK